MEEIFKPLALLLGNSLCYLAKISTSNWEEIIIGLDEFFHY